MLVVEHSVGHSQFAPSPLTEEFTILLNLHPDIKNLLNGFLEAVEVIVNQSCEGQREDRVKSITSHRGKDWACYRKI